ncbi:MAG TPA: flavodoxin [Oscillospiraceae bacterium]|nr:flavodoxin [Oscillospiraceae bacterium]
MGTLVVYFSLDGDTEFIAKKIAETLDAEIIALNIRKKYPAKGFFKYFCGGKSVLFGEKPKLTNKKINLSRYETMIIGTPVWAGSYTPPIKSFISQYKIRDKRIALFACHGGGGTEKCFAKLKKALPGNKFIGEIDYIGPKKNPEESSAQTIKWAKSLSAE